MKNEKYNGWSNYATWRVNLEVVDGQVETIRENKETFETIVDLADMLKDDVEEYLENEDSGNIAGAGLCYHYAIAFLSDVNWYEIAESVLSDYPELIKKD